jgi:hypothetical protein
MKHSMQPILLSNIEYSMRLGTVSCKFIDFRTWKSIPSGQMANLLSLLCVGVVMERLLIIKDGLRSCRIKMRITSGDLDVN